MLTGLTMSEKIRRGHGDMFGGEQWTMTVEIRLFRALDNRKPALQRLWDILKQP